MEEKKLRTEPPVFLVGSDRSGTTLLRLILLQSHNLHIPSETGFLPNLRLYREDYGNFSRPQERWFFLRDLQHTHATPETLAFDSFDLTMSEAEAAIEAVAPTTYAGAAAALFQATARKQGKTRWGDKTPLHVLEIEWLASAFPGSQFVHIIRDPRDVASSICRAGWQPNLLKAAEFWRYRVSAGCRAGRKLDPSRYREIRYEELVQAPEAQLKPLCMWLGMEYTPAMLRFYESSEDALPEEHRDYFPLINKPVDSSRAFAWKGTMNRRSVAKVEKVAGNLMQDLGYEVTGAKRSPWPRGIQWSLKQIAGEINLVTDQDQEDQGVQGKEERPNVLALLHRTLRGDERTYWRQKRPLTIRRRCRQVVPNIKRPIFIIGAPRSGTSFLGDCIGVLPEISYHHEPIVMKTLAREVYNGTWEFAEARSFYRNVYRLLMRLHMDGDLRFAEKTPRNCFLIPFLHRAFPDAQFIHIIRDGRDVALSYSKEPWLRAAYTDSGEKTMGGEPCGPHARFWVEPERVQEFEDTTDIHRCIWAWRRHVERALEAASALPPNQYHELRYEELTQPSSKPFSRLLNFLEITDFRSHFMFQAALRRARSCSVGRWRRELSEEELRRVKQEAGPLLRKLGYA